MNIHCIYYITYIPSIIIYHMYSLCFPDSCHLHGSIVRLFFGAILLKIKYIIPEVAKENKQDPPVYLMADELRKSPILDSLMSLFKESHKGYKHTEISARCTCFGDEHQEII